MRLSVEHRRQVITIYIKNNLHLKKNRIKMLQQLENEVDIEASDKTFRKLVKKWSETGRFDDEKSRKINNTKINRRQLISVDRLVQGIKARYKFKVSIRFDTWFTCSGINYSSVFEKIRMGSNKDKILSVCVFKKSN